MKTLHELAIRLQEYIINAQRDAHNEGNLNVSKYNNLKLRMETKLHYPNIIVSIGISEATYNFKEGTKTAGSLGPDEKHVMKWLSSSAVHAELKEMYVTMCYLVRGVEETRSVSILGEADEVKKEPVRKKQKFRSLLETGKLADKSGVKSDGEGQVELPAEEVNKKGIKDMLKSMIRKK